VPDNVAAVILGTARWPLSDGQALTVGRQSTCEVRIGALRHHRRRRRQPVVHGGRGRQHRADHPLGGRQGVPPSYAQTAVRAASRRDPTGTSGSPSRRPAGSGGSRRRASSSSSRCRGSGANPTASRRAPAAPCGSRSPPPTRSAGSPSTATSWKHRSRRPPATRWGSRPPGRQHLVRGARGRVAVPGHSRAVRGTAMTLREGGPGRANAHDGV